MGNQDLVLIFNDAIVFIILGKDYNNREDAIQLGLDKWYGYINELKMQADYPEEITSDIKSIHIYEVEVEG